MAAKRESSRTFGIGFFGLLGLIFITLKLAEIGQVTAWSWWLVLLPIYGPPALIIAVVVLGGLLVLLAALADAILERR